MHISLSFCRALLKSFLSDPFITWMLFFYEGWFGAESLTLYIPKERMHYGAILSFIFNCHRYIDPMSFICFLKLIFFLVKAHDFNFIAVEIQVFITVYIPKGITFSALNTVKYSEENTEYSIFASSESLSLTHGDNNYSALRRRTWIMDPILSKQD